MYYHQYSSITSEDQRHVLYVDTSSGDGWLETDGVLVCEDNVDEPDTNNQLFIDLAYEFTHQDDDNELLLEFNEEE